MAVRVDIPDIGPIEIQGAAEEATLKAILAEMKAGNRPGGGGGGAGGGAGGIGGAAASALKLTKTLNPLMVAVGGVTKIFGGLFRGVQALAGGFASAVDTFAKGRPSMTDFTTAVADAVPGAIKPFADALNSVIKLLYSNFTTFEKLTGTGIALGDQITTMQTGFKALGLTAEEIGGALGPAADGLASLGTASRGGAIALNQLKRLTAEQSMEMRLYGITVGEQAEKLTEYVAQNALGLRMRTTSEKQLLGLGIEYQKNLRRLSELTGQQADDIAQGMAKANMNENFRNFLAGMDGATRARIESIVNTAEAGFGDAGREAAMAAVLGIAPVTDSAQMLTSTMGGFNSTIQNSVSTAKAFTGSQADYNKLLIGNFRDLANANAGFVQRTNRLGATLGLAGDPLGQTFNEMARFTRIFGGTLEETESNLGNVDDMGRAAIKTEQAIANLRSALMNIVGIIGKELTPHLETFATWMQTNSGLLNEWSDQLKKDIEGAGGFVPYLKQVWYEWMIWFKTALNDTFLGDLMINDKKLTKDQEKVIGTEGMEKVNKAMQTGDFTGLKDLEKRVLKHKLEQEISRIDMQGYSVGGADDPSGEANMNPYYFDTNAMKKGKEEKKRLETLVDQLEENSFFFGTGKGGNPADLFQNFGKGQAAMLHGEEAVIPKNSHAGNMLQMMGGMMGDMKSGMKDGKMDFGKMMTIAQEGGDKLNAYATENAAGIKAESRGMVKNLTGLSDEQLDKMEAESVQSNNKASSGTSVNNITGGMGAKLDELIKLNREMLAELQSM